MARGQRDTAKERFWRRVIRQWRRSDGTVRDFCDSQGVSEPSFYAWRRTLAARDHAAKQRRRRPRSARQRRETADATPTFLPVQIVPTNSVDTRLSGIEIVAGNGHVVRVAPGFDIATLRRLLAVLEEPC